MHFKKIITGLAFIGSVAAAPSFNSAIARDLTKRALPSFSKWAYGARDWKEQMDKLLLAWPEVIHMAIFLHVKPDPGLYDEVYKHYFKTEDSAAVADVWRLLLGAKGMDDQGDGTGNPEFSKLHFINYSPYNSDPCDYSAIAYLSEPDANGDRDFRVCDKAFEYPLIADSTCDDIGDKVSGLMSTLSGILLHELMHYDPIGKVATGSHIQDYDRDGYGPVNTRKLLNDPDVGSTITNADNYRWMALEYYWSYSCDKSFGDATDNRDYRQCKDGDDEDACDM